MTVSGDWRWTTHHSDCNLDRFAVGWAIDWNDPNQAGNLIGTANNVSVDVGAASANTLNPADNAVKFDAGPPKCGVYGAHPDGSCNTGSWGPESHTYSADTAKIEVCAVMYDIHNHAKGGPKPHGKPDKGGKGGKGDKGGKPGPGPAGGPKAGDLVAGGPGHNHDNSVQENGNTPLGNGCSLTVVTTSMTESTTTTTTEPTTTTTEPETTTTYIG